MNRKPKQSRAVMAARQAKVIEAVKDGVPQAQIAADQGVHPVTIWRDMQRLTEQFAKQNSGAFTEIRRAQLAVFELMEKSLLEGTIAEETAREWRGIRSEISKLLGLNVEQRSVVAHLHGEIDPAQLVGYRRFLHETRNVPEAKFQLIWDFIRTIEELPTAELRPHMLPPSDSPLWHDAEEKQLPEGESSEPA
jgi:hypothetical protein